MYNFACGTWPRILILGVADLQYLIWRQSLFAERQSYVGGNQSQTDIVFQAKLSADRIVNFISILNLNSGSKRYDAAAPGNDESHCFGDRKKDCARLHDV